MTKSLLLRCALALAMLASAATPALAWDDLAHKVVARIAWEHMTPRARANAIALLMAAPANSGIRTQFPDDGRPLEERQREWFVNMAYWADLIRDRDFPGNRYHQSDWHYVNWFWEQRTPGGRAIDRPDLGTAGNLLNRLKAIDDSLSARPTPENALHLAWLLHLAGDVHQPLHNSARVTPQDPEGDRGGNSVRFPGVYPLTNLHAVWDGIAGPAFPWRVGERTEHAYIGRIAQTVQQRQPRRRFARELAPGEFTQWSQEGIRVAQRVAYPVWLVRDRPLPRRYLPYAWQSAEPRIALAGYRLADMLNRKLGEQRACAAGQPGC